MYFLPCRTWSWDPCRSHPPSDGGDVSDGVAGADASGRAPIILQESSEEDVVSECVTIVERM
jgi:hypothetical protein